MNNNIKNINNIIIIYINGIDIVIIININNIIILWVIICV